MLALAANATPRSNLKNKVEAKAKAPCGYCGTQPSHKISQALGSGHSEGLHGEEHRYQLGQIWQGWLSTNLALAQECETAFKPLCAEPIYGLGHPVVSGHMQCKHSQHVSRRLSRSKFVVAPIPQSFGTLAQLLPAGRPRISPVQSASKRL